MKCDIYSIAVVKTTVMKCDIYSIAVVKTTVMKWKGSFLRMRSHT